MRYKHRREDFLQCQTLISDYRKWVLDMTCTCPSYPQNVCEACARDRNTIILCTDSCYWTVCCDNIVCHSIRQRGSLLSPKLHWLTWLSVHVECAGGGKPVELKRYSRTRKQDCSGKSIYLNKIPSYLSLEVWFLFYCCFLKSFQWVKLLG